MNPTKAAARIKTLQLNRLNRLTLTAALEVSRTATELEHAVAQHAPNDNDDDFDTAAHDENDEYSKRFWDRLGADEEKHGEPAASGPGKFDTPQSGEASTEATERFKAEKEDEAAAFPPAKRCRLTETTSDDDIDDSASCSQRGAYQHWYSCWQCGTVACSKCTSHQQCLHCASLICSGCSQVHRNTCEDRALSYDDLTHDEA